MSYMIEEAHAEVARFQRFQQSFDNGATTASIAPRHMAEERYGLASRALMRAGVMYPLKHKYNPYR